jgi:hypothetical protein
MRKTPALLVIVILLSGGMARSAPITGVVLQNIHQQNGQWVAQLVNVSHKNVVYVNISTNDYSESGAYYSPDDSQRITFPDRIDGVYPHRGGDTFPPNATKDIQLGTDKESIVSVVGVVVYADDTAEVVNERAFKSHLLPIKEEVMTLEKENEILTQFASSPNRIADTVAELLRVASDLPDPQMRHDEDAHVNSNNLLSLPRELKQGRVDPEKAMKENAEQIEIETKHANIKRITGAAA